MADYVPLFDPGDEFTMSATAAVTGGQVVEITGTRAVAPTGGASVKVAGVALFDALVGSSMTVMSAGVHELIASAAINAGDLVTSAAAGQVASFGAGTNYAQVIGRALTTAAAANAKVQVLFP